MTASPTEAAEQCRLDLGVDLDQPIADLVASAESALFCHVYVVDLPGGTIEGACVPAGRDTLIFLAKHSKAGRAYQPVRQRFTLAHEIGHLRLGHGARLDSHVSVGAAGPASQEERDANEFASALLMPTAAIENWLANTELTSVNDLETFARFAGYFGVSSPAAYYRLSTEGLFEDALASGRIAEAVNGTGATELRKSLGAWRYGDVLQQLHDERGYRFPPQFIEQAQELFGDELLTADEYRVYTDGQAERGA